MNYLELVQRTIKESGAHLSVPDSLSGLDGLHSMFVDWVNQAWVELQLERPEWYFRMSEDSIRQINSTTLERGVKIPISRLPSEFAPNWNSIQLFDIYIRNLAYTDTEPEAAPVWDVVGQKTAAGGNATLTVSAPDNVSAGDHVMMLVYSETDPDVPVSVATSDGFHVGPTVFRSFEPATVALTLLYKISDGVEPSHYIVHTHGEGTRITRRVSATRVIGLDPGAPIAGTSIAVGTGPWPPVTWPPVSKQLIIPGVGVERDKSLILSAAIGIEAIGLDPGAPIAGTPGIEGFVDEWTEIPDTEVLNLVGITMLAAGIDTQDTGPTGDKLFDTESSRVDAGFVVVMQAPLPTDSYDSPTKLCYIPWSSWASFMGKSQFHLDYNDQEEVIGRPEYFTITPTGEVWIYPIPDANYEINIFGPKKIQELSEDTDEPYLESEYRLAIVFRALMEYALYHEDRSVFERARNKYRSYKKALEHRYMPDINLNTSSLYRDIC